MRQKSRNGVQIISLLRISAEQSADILLNGLLTGNLTGFVKAGASRDRGESSGDLIVFPEINFIISLKEKEAQNWKKGMLEEP